MLGSVLFSLGNQERALSFSSACVWCVSELPLDMEWVTGIAVTEESLNICKQSHSSQAQAQAILCWTNHPWWEILHWLRIKKVAKEGKFLAPCDQQWCPNIWIGADNNHGSLKLIPQDLWGVFVKSKVQRALWSLPKSAPSKTQPGYSVMSPLQRCWGKALLLTNLSTTVLLALFGRFRWKSRQDYADPPFVCLNHKSISWELKAGV